MSITSSPRMLGAEFLIAGQIKDCGGYSASENSFLKMGAGPAVSLGLQNVRFPTNPIYKSSATSHPPNSNSFRSCWSFPWVFS
jgi:hypothetical protein